MAVKTITITEASYLLLKAAKKENESFSKTITRIAGTPSLREFAGILSTASANKLEKSIKESRQHHRKMHEKRVARMRPST
ncbi:MAG: antitoxin VapB family protein [Candidatus Woesearchaeota archaeon]|nr:antitoxin VapB family protein [Candidatus Woesearchaeota archaeon]